MRKTSLHYRKRTLTKTIVIQISITEKAKMKVIKRIIRITIMEKKYFVIVNGTTLDAGLSFSVFANWMI